MPATHGRPIGHLRWHQAPRAGRRDDRDAAAMMKARLGKTWQEQERRRACRWRARSLGRSGRPPDEVEHHYAQALVAIEAADAEIDRQTGRK
jgi:hypothetical protein